MEKQLVIFTLGAEAFGVNISDVESIIKMQEITRVPQSPDFVVGITNLRGAVLPVIDLRQRMQLATGEHNSETRIVIVNQDNIKIGMIVDAVSEVLTVSEEQIASPPPMVSSVDTALITGVAHQDDRLVILLDLQRVLSSEEQAALPA